MADLSIITYGYYFVILFYLFAKQFDEIEDSLIDTVSKNDPKYQQSSKYISSKNYSNMRTVSINS